MNTIKRITLIAVAAIAAAALCSCGKDNAGSVEGSGAIAGTWELVKYDYTFCGEDVGSEAIPKNSQMMVFREDGICKNIQEQKEDDGGTPIPYFQYKYSEKNKSLSLILGMFITDYKVIILNATELILSLSGDSYYIGTYKIGKEVDTYKGVTIYEYRIKNYDEYIWDGEYCYKDSKGDIVPCKRISDEEFDGTFTGDKNGYYDTIVSHLKRVK